MKKIKMNRLDEIRRQVYELDSDYFRLIYLSNILDAANYNPLFKEKERQEYIDEVLEVQKEVIRNMRKEVNYKEQLTMLMKSYE